MQVLYIVNYSHDIRFQVDHVWTIRGSSFANLKDKRGLKEKHPGPEGFDSNDIRFQANNVWTIRGPSFANLNLRKYSLESFCLFLWKNAGFKHGKMLVPYKVIYFHEIRFQVDHVWTITGPNFANLKDKWGLKEKQPSQEGYHYGSYMCFCFK